MSTSRTVAGVTAERLHQLQGGKIATRMLTEALAIDQTVLLRNVLPDAPESLYEAVRVAQSRGILARMQAIGAALHEHLGDTIATHFAQHPSDTVRGWVCFAIAANPSTQTVEMLLPALKTAADDSHFAVREWVWMAARSILSANLTDSIEYLASWTSSDSERIRRFTSEALRPRGVWAKHIAELKTNPELGLPILESLRSDTSRYVQDSVANWVNDASKTRPDWAQLLGARWLHESPTSETRRIVTRGLRSISAT